MKRTTIYLYAALALLAGLAACTKDELSSLSGGVEGAPMTFTATGLNPAATAAAGTRAPVDGNWEDVTTVAVRMDGIVKAYTVTPDAADNTRATLASVDPHYWTNHDNITVTAWWPYAETLPAVKVAADQSAQKDFEGSDLIVADGQTVTYGAPTLTFTHRTARVTVALTDRPEESMNVRLTGLSTEGGNPAVITPYYDEDNDTYAALVAPQTVTAGTAIITCTFTNGKTYAYRMNTTAQWKAGEEYTYTVSLAAAEGPGYTYDDATHTYIVHSAKGLLAWNEAAQKDMSLNCTLIADIDMPKVDEGESNWTPIGTDFNNPYTGTFDGGGHTITGLTVDLPNQTYAGLIGYLGGTVQNLTLAEVKIDGNFAGGVVSHADYTATVTNCTVSGDVTVTGYGDYVGGVVGYSDHATVTACYFTGTVTATGEGGSVGGVVGFVTGGASNITACYHATGTVSGPDVTTGGVAGYSTTTACYWRNNLDKGVGSIYDSSSNVTKVDGTDATWQTAQSGMNAAIETWNDGNPNKQCNWRYAETDATTPPTLEPVND